jgi:hypothetical protein
MLSDALQLEYRCDATFLGMGWWVTNRVHIVIGTLLPNIENQQFLRWTQGRVYQRLQREL